MNTENKSIPSCCDGVIHVCGWCHPGKSVYLIRPEWLYLNLPISHGICIHHKNEVLASIYASGERELAKKNAATTPETTLVKRS